MKLSDKQKYLSYAVFVEQVLNKFDACESIDGVENSFVYLNPFGGLDSMSLIELICEGKFNEAIDLVNKDKRLNEENENQLDPEERLKDDERNYCLMAYDTLKKVIEIMK